jgi:hypothetical protein
LGSSAFLPSAFLSSAFFLSPLASPADPSTLVAIAVIGFASNVMVFR